ncbi:septum site-determining protein Ssd [Gordonia sp. VNK21]|uniref:septum site-determining protein Ssd n=1 Tax=Gordonia sp. VNK21 TaxID=3382483 RepID=UPI0038D4648A
MGDGLLVLTGPERFDDVARCGAAAGYAIVRGHPADCRRDWLRAAAVVVDGGALNELGRREAPQRDGVLLVGGADDDPAAWRAGLLAGARGGYVLPDEEAALVAALSALRRPSRHAAGTIAVVGGHGGAGVSTLAAAIALAASRERQPALLLDVEPGGAGLDLLLGAEQRSGLRWNAVTGQTGSIGGAALAAALPAAAPGVGVLTRARDDGAPLPEETVLAALDAGRTNGDLVIADVGRGTGGAAAAVLESVELLLIVCMATVPAVSATRKLVARLPEGPRTVLVVRGPAPGGLTAADVAAAIGVELLAGLRSEGWLPRCCEAGGLRYRRRSALHAAAHSALTLARRSGRVPA